MPKLPPPPPGFEIVGASGSVPPPPPGFELIDGGANKPPAPAPQIPGFEAFPASAPTMPAMTKPDLPMVSGNPLVSGLRSGVQQAKGAVGSILEMGGSLQKNEPLRQVGEKIRTSAQQEAELHQPRVPGVEDIRSPKDALSWLGYQIGSQAPNMAASVAGGVTGALAGGPAGAVAGAGGVSYILNAGDAYANMRSQGVGHQKAAAAAAAAGVPMALFDAIVPVKVAGQLVWKPVKKAGAKALIGEAAKTALKEGVPEGAQEAISAAAEQMAGGTTKLWSPETASRILNATAAGTVMGVGAGMGGEVASRARKPVEAPSVTGQPAPVAEPAPTPAVEPKRGLNELLEAKGVEVEYVDPADESWWADQPETRPEAEARYAQLFAEAEKRNAARGMNREKRRAAVAVPEEGIPEEVARAVDARERLAVQVAKKPWAELSNPERVAIDELIAEGYTGAGGAPVEVKPETPAPVPVKPETPSAPAPPIRTEPAPVSDAARTGKVEAPVAPVAPAPRPATAAAPDIAEGSVFRNKVGEYRVTQVTENEVSYEFTGKNGKVRSASMPAEEFGRLVKGAEGQPTPVAAPTQATEATTPVHDYSSTQANLPSRFSKQVKAIAARIPDDKLSADGRENEPHITVKYGLHTDDAAPVQELLAGEPPIKAKFGKASLFQNEDADVLKVDIESPDLHRLNKKIAESLPNTDTHPEYIPHATIAYLKPGEGKKYAGKPLPGITGNEVTLDTVTFSGKDGKTVDVKLGQASRATTTETRISGPTEQVPAPAVEQAGAVAGETREPWQMTRAEYDKYAYDSEQARLTAMVPSRKPKSYQRYAANRKPGRRTGWDSLVDGWRRIEVQKAIAEGKPVPPEVLADYPDLATSSRRPTQRGSFSLRPANQPRTPGEIYAAEMVAKREAARKGPVKDLVTRIKSALDKLKAEGVDSTAPILDAIARSQKKYGYELRESAKIENKIDRAYRAASLAEQFIDSPISEGGRSLTQIIRDVENIDYFDQYLVAQHAQTVERLHQTADKSATPRNLVKDSLLIDEARDRIAIPASKEVTYTVNGQTRTFQSAADLQQQIQAGNVPAGGQAAPVRPAVTYGQAAAEVTKFSQKILDYSVDAGLIDPELAAKLKEIYPDYVPLKRVFTAIEKGEFHGGGGKAVASLSKQTIVQRLEGSQREIENPIYSLIEKAHDAFAQGERNKAGRQLAEYRDLPGFEGMIQELKPGELAPPHLSFSFLDAGKKRTFRTTPEIAAAAKSLNIQQIGLLGKIINGPVRLAKTFTTSMNPKFIMTNLFADARMVRVTAKHSGFLADPSAFFQALMSAVKHDDLWNEMVGQGAGFTSFDQYRGQPKSTIDSIRSRRNKYTYGSYLITHPAQLFRVAENIVSKSEEFGRVRLYRQAKTAALREGRTEADARAIATREANNRLPNYMRAGDWGRALNGAFMYLNAGVQGVRSFTRAMSENPVRTSARIATSLFLPVTLATLWNLSDEDRKKAYADIREYEKDNNLIFLMSSPTKDKQNRYEVIKLKLPPGLNQLTIPLRRALEAAAGLDPVKFREIVDAVIGSVSPVEPNLRSAASTFLPQIIKPSVQAMANYDFFRGAPKVPGRLQGLPPEMQVLPYTSATGKKIGESLGVAPILVDEFVKDTIGGLGGEALNLSDQALAAVGAIPRSEIGGSDLVEGVASRFMTARGGELDSREYEARKALETSMVRKAVEKARRTSYFRSIAGKEELEQKYLTAVANRVKALMTRTTGSARFKRMPAAQRVAELKRITPALERRAVAASVLRPVVMSRQ
jgi:hypothetical protein